MKNREFYIAALSILSARGELAGSVLKEAVEGRLNVKALSERKFSANMGHLEELGAVIKELRPALSEARAPQRETETPYYIITHDGKNLRISLASSTSGFWSTPKGLPQPAYG